MTLESPHTDPYWETRALKKGTDALPLDGTSDGEMENGIGAGESMGFLVQVNNTDSGGVRGIVIRVPAGCTGKYTLIGSKSNGVGYVRGGSTFNESFGRFGPGQVTVFGTLHNGSQPGMVQVGWGEPQDDDVSDEGDVDSEEGTETITLSAGFWLVTFQIMQTVDMESPDDEIPRQVATVSGGAQEYSEAWVLPWEEA